MIAEEISRAHLIEWDGFVLDPRAHLLGCALRGCDGRLQAVLAVFTLVDRPPAPDLPGWLKDELTGAWWCAMDSRQPVSPLAHRYALKVKTGLKKGGIRRVYADADPDIEGSEKWLQRLGFEPLACNIWRCDLVLGSEGDRATSFGPVSEGGRQAAQGCGL